MILLLREAFSIPRIRYNLLAYIFIWAVYGTTYNDIFLSLQTVGGNIYLKILCICFMEICGSFTAAWITQKFEVLKVLNLFYLIITIINGFFLFASVDASSPSVFYLICLFLIKFSADIINSLINVITPSFFTDSYIVIYISFSRLLSRVFLFSLPTINFLLESNNYHSFSLLFILWGICKLLSIKTAEVDEEENIPHLMNEMHIELSSRMSFIATNQFETSTQILGGIDLGEIRLSRKKSKGIEMEELDERRRKLLES